MRTFDTDNIFKLYDGQLNKLFNLGHMTVDSMDTVFVYFKSPIKIKTIRFKSALFRFICKYIYKLNLNHIVLCFTHQDAALLVSQYEKASNELDQQISAAFLNMINVDIENAPSLKSTERILRHKYKFEECEKPWEAE